MDERVRGPVAPRLTASVRHQLIEQNDGFAPKPTTFSDRNSTTTWRKRIDDGELRIRESFKGPFTNDTVVTEYVASPEQMHAFLREHRDDLDWDNVNLDFRLPKPEVTVAAPALQEVEPGPDVADEVVNVVRRWQGLTTPQKLAAIGGLVAAGTTAYLVIRYREPIARRTKEAAAWAHAKVTRRAADDASANGQPDSSQDSHEAFPT